MARIFWPILIEIIEIMSVRKTSGKCSEIRIMSKNCPENKNNVQKLSGKISISHFKKIDCQNSGQWHIPDKMSVGNGHVLEHFPDNGNVQNLYSYYLGQFLDFFRIYIFHRDGMWWGRCNDCTLVIESKFLMWGSLSRFIIVI